MQKIKILRKDFVNNWDIKLESKQKYYFPLEKELYKKITTQNKLFFLPIKIKAYEDVDYNIKISYLISALDLLPRKMDIASDFMWRAFERSLEEKYIQGNITEQLRNELYFYSTDREINEILDKVIICMPNQSWEFIAKHIKENFDRTKNWNCQNGIIKRITCCDDKKENRRLQNLYNLIIEVDKKYFMESNSDNDRKASMLLKYYFTKKIVNINGVTFNCNDCEKISILINGLLYSFRNDRTHADKMSPFLSSTATITTYMHCHYVFLLTYFLFLFSGLEKHGIKRKKIIDNINKNMSVFKNFYGKKLSK